MNNQRGLVILILESGMPGEWRHYSYNTCTCRLDHDFLLVGSKTVSPAEGTSTDHGQPTANQIRERIEAMRHAKVFSAPSFHNSVRSRESRPAARRSDISMQLKQMLEYTQSELSNAEPKDSSVRYNDKPARANNDVQASKSVSDASMSIVGP